MNVHLYVWAGVSDDRPCRQGKSQGSFQVAGKCLSEWIVGHSEVGRLVESAALIGIIGNLPALLAARVRSARHSV